jgi:hypothetical protein
MKIGKYTFTEDKTNKHHPAGVYISYTHNLPYTCLDRIVTIDGEWHGVNANWNGASEVHKIDINAYVSKCEDSARLLGYID